jgi:hypothetical protein
MKPDTTLEIAIFEWPNDGSRPPQILGRTVDPELVAKVRSHIAAEQRRRLARLEGPRLVENPEES